MPDLRDQLQTYFGLDDFRPAQRGVIEDVLAGRDVLCVMPTGAGKSLCYQLPAVVQGGLTIVVSPLISLMEDQVSQLRDEGIASAMLSSNMPPDLRREAMAQLDGGFEGLFYVAPERFFAGNFQQIIGRQNVKLLAIDEAHCISQWGHDFRPEYARLGEVRRLLGSPPTIALTATATEDVRQDIIHQLDMREPSVVITGFDRLNLIYESRRVSKVAEKDAELLHLLQNEPGSGIVYCATRKNVDLLSTALAERLRGRLVVPYHAGLESTERTGNQEKFMDTPGAIAIATNAFGMGINKPDIRFVVHYNLPGTLEAYYQEAGRAGRDGTTSRCTLLYSFQDRKTQEFFIDKLGEQLEGTDADALAERKQRATDKLDLMVRYAQTHRCRRQQILDYFGDEAEVIDCQCDVCRGESGSIVTDHTQPLSEEIVMLTRKLLSGVARLNGRFGVGAVAEVLAGIDNERAQRWQLNSLSVFGLLKKFPTKRLIAMLHRLIEAGLCRQRSIEGSHGSLIEISPTGVAVMKALQPPPGVLVDLVPSGGSRAMGTNARAFGTNPKSLRSKTTIEMDESPMDEDAQSRFDRLRAVRTQLAKAKALPAYCICHDRTLAQIARAAPSSLVALEDIKGMGPFKVKMYGEQLLAAMAEG